MEGLILTEIMTKQFLIIAALRKIFLVLYSEIRSEMMLQRIIRLTGKKNSWQPKQMYDIFFINECSLDMKQNIAKGHRRNFCVKS